MGLGCVSECVFDSFSVRTTMDGRRTVQYAVRLWNTRAIIIGFGNTISTARCQVSRAPAARPGRQPASAARPPQGSRPMQASNAHCSADAHSPGSSAAA